MFISSISININCWSSWHVTNAIELLSRHCNICDTTPIKGYLFTLTINYHLLPIAIMMVYFPEMCPTGRMLLVVLLFGVCYYGNLGLDFVLILGKIKKKTSFLTNNCVYLKIGNIINESYNVSIS